MTSQKSFSHKFLNNTTFVMQLNVFTFTLDIYVCSRILLYKCFVISLYTEIALANVKLCLSTNSHTHIHVDVYFVDEMKILNKATFSWNDFSYVYNARNYNLKRSQSFSLKYNRFGCLYDECICLQRVSIFMIKRYIQF